MRKFFRKIVIILVFILFAIAGYYIYDTFHERTYTEKLAAIIHYEDSRVLTSELEEYLQDENPDLRARAALAVGRIGAKGSGKLLFEMIKTESMDIASSAAFAIGLTKEKQYAMKLLDLAFDYPSSVGAIMVEAVGRLSDSSMTDEIDILVDFLSHPSPDVRQSTCLALYRAGAKNKGQELIDFIENELDEEVQAAALYALVRLSVKEASEIYIKFFADADYHIRSLATRGVGLSDSKQAIHYLTIALNDGDAKVVTEAIKQLAKKKNAQARKKLVQKLQRENDEKLLIELIDALRYQENPEGLDVVLNILSFNPPANIVMSAVKYLAAIQKDRAVNLIDSLVLLNNPKIKAASAEAYGIIGTKNIIPRLAVLFSDNDEMVRAGAFESLAQIDSGNIDFYLGKALDDSSFILPVLAVGEIENRHLSSYLPTLCNIVKQSRSVSVDIRRAIVESAASFIDENIKDTNAVRILISGILDPEYIVRLDAARLYKELLDDDRFSMVPPVRTKFSERKIRKAVEEYSTYPYALIETNKGEIELDLFNDVAPLTVLNFIELAKDGFYDGLIFHRVVSNFVVQGGDPQGTGWGGPSYYIRCEYSDRPYNRGTVGMATSGRDTGGSQFFITLSPQPHLEARYTVFGEVLTGMEVVDQIVPGDTIITITIKKGKHL